MKIFCLYQSKNEGLINNRAVLEQSKLMSDGIIILDDNSTDDSFPDEIIKDSHVIEYLKLPEKDMHEGINMSVLLNLAHKHGADWCYFPGGHYRYKGDIKGFKTKLLEYDKLGITHVNLRWFTMWDELNYRNDGEYTVANRYFCDVWKLQPHTWFKTKTAHCTHPENSTEIHTVMDDVFSITYGRDSVEKRNKKFDLYSKMKGMDENFNHYLDEKVTLELFDLKKMKELVVESNKVMPKYWIMWNGFCFLDNRIIDAVLEQELRLKNERDN